MIQKFGISVQTYADIDYKYYLKNSNKKFIYNDRNQTLTG